MRNQSANNQSLWSALLSRSNPLLAAGALVLGMATLGVTSAVANSATPQSTVQAERLPDGVYLYGQSSQPDQVGQGYFVFEVNQGHVMGALYMPRSSFDCASGQFEKDQLALTVVNSYDRTTNPFEISLEQNSTVASNGKLPRSPVGLQGFQRLSNVSENDYRLLNVCKTDFSQQAKSQSL